MTEVERLQKRLFESRTTHFHVFWGPKAHELTIEERAAEINKALDQAGRRVETIDGHVKTTSFDAAFTEAPRSRQPTVNVREWVAERMKEKKMSGGA